MKDAAGRKDGGIVATEERTCQVVSTVNAGGEFCASADIYEPDRVRLNSS